MVLWYILTGVGCLFIGLYAGMALQHRLHRHVSRDHADAVCQLTDLRQALCHHIYVADGHLRDLVAHLDEFDPGRCAEDKLVFDARKALARAKGDHMGIMGWPLEDEVDEIFKEGS